jgi:hypothetical protein
MCGVEPVVVDVFDARALSAVVLNARPDIIIHQLTDLLGLSAAFEPVSAWRGLCCRETEF